MSSHFRNVWNTIAAQVKIIKTERSFFYVKNVDKLIVRCFDAGQIL